MAGTLIVSNLKTDTDNSFIVRSNTGTTLFVANTTGIDVANSFASSSITSDKILTVANTKISGNIISSQITSVANTQISGNIISSQIASVNGSVITANTIANSAIQTGAVENYMNAAGLGFGMRNRIINGAMAIDQRNAGASINNTNTGTQFSVDRWAVYGDQNSKFSIQQNAGAVTPPAGFTYYLGMTSSSAYTVGAAEQFKVYQSIEGYNMADLGWGAAGASAVTLSFWARSSLTGTFGGSLINNSNNRSYPFSYAISSANTWEYKTVTIAGDTTGTWGTTNGTGVAVQFSMGTGSSKSGTAGAWAASNLVSVTGAVSVVGTSGATLYLAGVQLEKSSTATSFDYRPYGTELNLCQRYYQSFVYSTDSYPVSACYSFSTTQAAASLPMTVPMRATPSASIVGNMCFRNTSATQFNLSSFGTIYYNLYGNLVFCLPTSTGLTTNTIYLLCNYQTTPSGYTLSAEL
jgi:hypothetical protein